MSHADVAIVKLAFVRRLSERTEGVIVELGPTLLKLVPR